MNRIHFITTNFPNALNADLSRRTAFTCTHFRRIPNTRSMIFTYTCREPRSIDALLRRIELEHLDRNLIMLCIDSD